ncbi:MAG: hypothetical protein ACE367_07110 [Acidimicrobiales bacterium]
MTRYAPNDAGIEKAESLIDAHQYVLESSWQEEAPVAGEENADIERHDWDQYGEWHLAVDLDASDETKDRYGFPYGDFRRVHRSALIAAKSRAAQNDHDEIAAAASRLLDHLDAVAADR